MFATLTTRFGSAMRLACRRTWTPQQRRDLILHLEPVEKLVRVLMIVEAITLLVMTPLGLKLRQTTKPCRIPDPPPQVGTHKPHPEASRLRAAMMTIAAHQPRIDPRVAEREAREAEQKRAAALRASAPALRRLRPRRPHRPLQRHPLDPRPGHAHSALNPAAQPDPRRSHAAARSTRSHASPSIRPTKTKISPARSSPSPAASPRSSASSPTRGPPSAASPVASPQSRASTSQRPGPAATAPSAGPMAAANSTTPASSPSQPSPPSTAPVECRRMTRDSRDRRDRQPTRLASRSEHPHSPAGSRTHVPNPAACPYFPHRRPLRVQTESTSRTRA